VKGIGGSGYVVKKDATVLEESRFVWHEKSGRKFHLS
jgi:hypothetical protein